MKMKPEHFAALSAILTDALQRNPDASEQYAKAGLSDTRLMWDCLHSTKWNIVPMYSYLNDSHITTALLRILAEYRKGVTK